MSDYFNTDNLQIWTSKEMISAFLAGIVVGFAVGIVF